MPSHSPSASPAALTPTLEPLRIEIPHCDRGTGEIICSPQSTSLIDGIAVVPLSIWPDDRGHFLEVLRVGCGLAAGFLPECIQVSATQTYPGVVKAFHYHRRQHDCWSAVSGMLQVALADLRVASPTFGRRNTLYIGELRPWQVLIPPGVAHGYKVIGERPAVLVYVTSRFYDPVDECRIRYDDSRLNYAWETQFK